MTCGMMTCEIKNLEMRVKFVFSPDVILCTKQNESDIPMSYFVQNKTSLTSRCLTLYKTIRV